MPKYIVGIDEAGRGPLAGPVTVGAVAIRANVKTNLPNRDSKKLSPKIREEWFKLITRNFKLKYCSVSISNLVIDRHGISHALRLGVKKAIKGLKIGNCELKILLDGSLYAPPKYQQKTIIKGDEKIPIISAASVIAKVTRDRKMIRLAKKYPEYNFDVHKGYGTRLHIQLVKKYGLCDIHRRSYCSRLI